jgi:ribosomal protein S18 acetylase RimI-like enzyme
MVCTNVRRARHSDIDRLHFIKRESFPESLKLKLPVRYWRKWWDHTILSPATEVYVITVDEAVAGFAVVVTDEGGYRKEAQNIKPSLLFYLYLLTTSPRHITLLCRKGMDRARALVCRNDHCDVESRGPFFDRTWLEVWAISPEYRGKGYAKILLNYIERRTMELYRGGIGLMVRNNNSVARCLFEKCGYKKNGRTSDYSFYRKEVRHQAPMEKQEQRGCHE